MIVLFRNPLNDYILSKEIKIDKVGYRARILNKLRTDAKIFTDKLKNSKHHDINQDKKKGIDDCACIVF